MKKTAKLLIAAMLLIAAAEVAAQEKCNYVCHNNTVIKTLNNNAFEGHLHHGDIFLGTCEDFTGEVGGACNVLTAPNFDFKQPLPLGKKYFIINPIGQIIKKGRVTEDFIKELPKDQLIFIKINGYKLKKIYKKFK